MTADTFDQADAGSSAGGARSDTRTGSGAARPLVSSAYLHTSRATHAGQAYKLDVYPSGVIMRRTSKLDVKPPVGFPRGAITEFTPEAARRLREFCVTHFVPGFQVLATTLTIHRPCSPEEWRAIMKRFGMTVLRRGWAGTWRVELQRRGVPHVHCALWLPEGVTALDVRDEWLAATREHDDRQARKHAVFAKWIQSEGWTVYLSLHDSKKKAAQLGWQGKQWGIWNRPLFTLRETATESRELPVPLENAVRRMLRGLMRSKGSRARIGRAGFLRCMEGRVMASFLEAWDQHRICPASGAVPDLRAGPRVVEVPPQPLKVAGRVVSVSPAYSYRVRIP